MASLADLKAEINSTDSVDDPELQRKLDAATAMVVNLVGPLSATDRIETHYGVTGPTVVLRTYPVMAVNSITYSYAGGNVDYTYTEFKLDKETGVIRLPQGAWFRGDITVDYTAGQPIAPEVDQAILIIAAHLWQTQRGAGLQPLQATDMGMSPGMGFALPNRALELLAGHLQGPKVAS